MSSRTQPWAATVMSFDAAPADGELHPRVMTVVRDMVMAEGADEEEATVLLLVIERLRRIQAEKGVPAALVAANAVKDIWLNAPANAQ